MASTGRTAVRVTDVEQHAFRYHASHLARLQIHHEQRLPAHNLLRIGAFCFHSGHDGALVIAEAHAQLDQLVGVWHIVHCEDRPDTNVNLIQDFQRNRRLDGRWHSHKITTEDTEDTEEKRSGFLRVLSVLRG